jgi:hypothetical protein
MSYPTLLLLLTLPAATERTANLLLADAGRTTYTIRVHRDAAAPERHAAEELARFLRQISGATFPVQTVEGPSPDSGPSLRVGPGAAQGFITPAEIARLGPEGYILRGKGTSLAIAGGQPRGTLYGVYSFLEDYLDCRWFTPRVARIPKKERLEVRSPDRTFVPRLEYRATDYPDARDADWAVRNKINGTQARLDGRRGGKVAYGPFVHTFDSILNPKDHFRRHPEYFSEVNGKRLGERTQLCLSNREVLRIATETVRRWMREQPEATIFSVSQNDWYNYCTCPDCARIAAEEGSQIGPYLRFVNSIADAVREEFPGKAIDTLAYQFTRQPPAKTTPRPNVIVRLCDIECCFSHPLTIRADIDRKNADFARDLRRWGAISNRLYIWDYVIDYAHSLLPFPNLYVLKPNINFFIEHGVKGIYEEANYFSKGGEFAELRTWIVAKTLWDPGYDTDRAIDEFLDGYYERAAAPLRRYIDLLHGKARMDAIHLGISAGPDSALFAGDVLSRASALFDEAERNVTDKPEILHRVRVARLPILYVQIASLLDKRKRTRQATEQESRLLQMAFDQFEAVARQEGVRMVSESRSYASWAAEVKQALATPPR